MKCLFCKKEFKVPRKAPNQKFCNQKCFASFKKGKISFHLEKYLFEKGHIPWNQGKTKRTDKRVKKLALNQMGKNHWNWKGGKINHNGYILLKKSYHPFATQRGYIPEHRVIMEEKLRRYLHSWEMVHHKNGIRDDNRPGNLELIIKQKKNAGAHFGEIICPKCGFEFLYP